MPNTYNLLLLLLITEEEDVVEEEHGILKKLFYVMLNFYVCFFDRQGRMACHVEIRCTCHVEITCGFRFYIER